MPSRSFAAFALVILLLASGVAHAGSGSKLCTPEQADAADQITDSLDSWPAVNAYFRKYRQCDDGSIAEGSSEAIARLLVDKWPTLPELVRLIEHDSRLKLFVLRHVNSTLATDDLQKIARNALSSCPKGSAPLCKSIHEAAAHALK